MCRKLIYSILPILVFASLSHGQFIGNISRSGSTNSAPRIAPNPLGENELSFVDRTYRYINIPDSLIGAQYVMVANKDKQAASYSLRVTIAKNANLYLFLDNRLGVGAESIKGEDLDLIRAGMHWVIDLGFTDTGDDIGIDESGDGNVDHYSSIFKKTVFVGESIVLGAQNDGGSRNMYGIAALASQLCALNPNPADGAIHRGSWVNLSWTPGDIAASHDVYFGDNFDAVNEGAEGTFQGNQASRYFAVCFPVYPYSQGRVSDTTYYWRVDEVESNGTTAHKGEVWSFTTEGPEEHYPGTDLPVVGTSLPGLSDIDSILLTWLGENDFKAATVAVMKDRRLVYKKGYGWQNSDCTQAISPDAVMRIASNTKPVTARAIQQLIEDRMIRASDRAYQYLDIPDRRSGEVHDERIYDITIQHILDHRSGLIGNAPGTGQLGRMLGLGRPATMAETIDYTCTRSLLFNPGSSSQYSNLGYQILGYIIEVVSGQTYEEYIHEHIAQPLGITSFQVARSGMGNALPNEIWYAGDRLVFPEIDVDYSLGRVPEPYAIDMETRPGAGSLVSSAEDFCRFLKSYFHNGQPKPDRLNGIVWTYTFFGSLPGTLSATRDMIEPDGSSISYVVLVNERIDGKDNLLSDLVSDLDAFLLNVSSWPDIDLFLVEGWITPSAPPSSPSDIDPLSQALDAALSFTTGGDEDWFSQNATYYHDYDAAQSGDITHDEESWLRTMINGAGIVSFFWMVSSEGNCDYLEFYIDDVLQDRISGSEDWHNMTYEITGPALHTLEWRYFKDGTVSEGDDCGWVDKVEWVAN